MTVFAFLFTLLIGVGIGVGVCALLIDALTQVYC